MRNIWMFGAAALFLSCPALAQNADEPGAVSAPQAIETLERQLDAARAAQTSAQQAIEELERQLIAARAGASDSGAALSLITSGSGGPDGQPLIAPAPSENEQNEADVFPSGDSAIIVITPGADRPTTPGDPNYPLGGLRNSGFDFEDSETIDENDTTITYHPPSPEAEPAPERPGNAVDTDPGDLGRENPGDGLGDAE